jgi:hypothetical protein
MRTQLLYVELCYCSQHISSSNMRLSSSCIGAILGVSLFQKQTNASKCGKWYSNDCLAETDPRYAEGGNNIKEQEALRAQVEGYWISESYFRNGDLESIGPNHFDPTEDPSRFPYNTPYPQSPFKIFERNVVEGS